MLAFRDLFFGGLIVLGLFGVFGGLGFIVEGLLSVKDDDFAIFGIIVGCILVVVGGAIMAVGIMPA